MDQKRVLTVSLEEWESLQQELRLLKQENQFLRKQAHGSMSPLLFKTKSPFDHNTSSMQSPRKDEEGGRKKFRKQMEEWSLKISQKVPSQQKPAKSGKIRDHSLSMSLYPVQMRAHYSQHEFSKPFQPELEEQNNKIEQDEEEEKEDVKVHVLSEEEDNQKQSGQSEAGEHGGRQQHQKSRQQEFKIKVEAVKSVLEKEEQGKESQVSKNNREGCKLIECICLYGPNWDQVEEKKPNKRMSVDHSLHYISDSKFRKQFQVYGEYFYPEGTVSCRRIREEEVMTQVNQVIFRKNTKKEDCSLYLFQADHDNHNLKQPNDMMREVNPAKWLTSFCIKFSDYHLTEIEEVEGSDGILNKSAEGIEPRTDTNLDLQKKSDRLKIPSTKKILCIKSTYTLCIFTYYPFINIMEQLLISILDEVKIRRVEKYAHESSKKGVAMTYFIKEIAEIGREVMSQINSIPPAISSDMHGIVLGHFAINFTLSRASFDNLIYGGWSFDVLKIFEKDLLYEIFTNILMEESLCFICDNLHLLTHVIFLFVSVLPQPFSYPYPCTSQMFTFDLLESPFPLTMGINENSKWLEENGLLNDKKIFIDLNEEPKVKGKRRLKTIKSQKLKKIFNNFYKRIESSSPLPQFMKKKGTIIKPASKEENELCTTFFSNLRNYFHEEILMHLPNPAIITHIRESSKEKNETTMIIGLIKEIQKYLKESRKQKERDNFVQLFVQQQVFYLYVCNRYNLD